MLAHYLVFPPNTFNENAYSFPLNAVFTALHCCYSEEKTVNCF